MKISLCVIGDPESSRWVAQVIPDAEMSYWRRDYTCCPIGHRRPDDAIDHGLGIARDALLKQLDHLPADSIGAEALGR